jgi:hypothetical protein
MISLQPWLRIRIRIRIDPIIFGKPDPDLDPHHSNANPQPCWIRILSLRSLRIRIRQQPSSSGSGRVRTESSTLLPWVAVHCTATVLVGLLHPVFSIKKLNCRLPSRYGNGIFYSLPSSHLLVCCMPLRLIAFSKFLCAENHSVLTES